MVAPLWLYRSLFGPLPQLNGASAIYLAMALGLISLPLAGLGVNLVSWLTPWARSANKRAMDGLEVSLWSMNRGLLYFGAVSIPVGAVLLALALIAPWRH
jgi:hypothetical protein